MCFHFLNVGTTRTLRIYGGYHEAYHIKKLYAYPFCGTMITPTTNDIIFEALRFSTVYRRHTHTLLLCHLLVTSL